MMSNCKLLTYNNIYEIYIDVQKFKILNNQEQIIISYGKIYFYSYFIKNITTSENIHDFNCKIIEFINPNFLVIIRTTQKTSNLLKKFFTNERKPDIVKIMLMYQTLLNFLKEEFEISIIEDLLNETNNKKVEKILLNASSQQNFQQKLNNLPTELVNILNEL